MMSSRVAGRPMPASEGTSALSPSAVRRSPSTGASDKQLRVVGQGERDRELYAHPLGQVHDALASVQLEQLAVTGEDGFVPVVVELARDIGDGAIRRVR